jgi:protein SMG6
MSEAASSSYAPRGPAPQASRSQHRSQPSRAGGDAPRLFDPRKDDPHHFGVIARPTAPNGSTAAPQNGRPTPTPKSSGDWVSASSTSSYAQSTISSNFTLNTTTTESSASSAIFDNGRRSEDSTASSNVLSSQLKHLYRAMTMLEDKLRAGDRDVDMQDDIYEDAHRIGVLQKGQPVIARTRQEEEIEQERYRKLIQDHKE